MKSKFIGILILVLSIIALGCVDGDHTPDVDIDHKIINDELIVTLKGNENYNNLKLEAKSEKLLIAPHESEILFPIDINAAEELMYHFKITDSGYEKGEKLNINIFLEDQNYNSRNIKSKTITYSPGQLPGFGIFTSLILFIFSTRLIKRKEVKS